MAEQDERSMIGYDPLAWLQESKAAEVTEPLTQLTTAPDESASVQQHADVDFTDPEASSSDTEDEFPEQDEKPITSFEGKSLEENRAYDLSDLADAESDVSLHDQVADAESALLSAGQLTLSASQTIQNVVELHEQLQRLLEGSSKIDIDASAVTQIDTATMQLLLVLKLTATNLQKEINIDFPSDRFLEAANLLGVAEMLSVDQAASGFF